MRRAIFLNRDGVVIEDVDLLVGPADVKILLQGRFRMEAEDITAWGQGCWT